MTVALNQGALTGGGRQGRRQRRAELRVEIVKHRWHYLFVVPMLVSLVLFTLWPIVSSWVYSFYSWDGFGPLTNYVGLDNFRAAMGDPAFWRAFRNTFAFSAASVFVQMPLALLFALVLNNPRLFGRNVYRVLLFIPVVSTTAVVGLIFAVLLDANSGPVNTFLMTLGLDRINFLGDSSTALTSVIAVETWRGLGITMIYWLAALQTIPSDVYDAAAIDGAGRWATLRHVTLPLLRPFAVIILLLTFITSFNAFDIVQTMTAGGPNGSSDIVQTYIYRYAFDPANFVAQYGFASAAGLLFGLVVMVLTLIQVLILRRGRGAKGGEGA